MVKLGPVVRKSFVFSNMKSVIQNFDFSFCAVQVWKQRIDMNVGVLNMLCLFFRNVT